ncbi:MAG TPA: PRC-barrel domain-containing protein [Pseudolabrys sp.]|nr:PRC-barrel domain-containing protein [Pseudolabrys sp.]
MKTFTAAVIGLTMLAGPALAQTNSNSNASSSSASSSSSQPQQNASTMNLWQGSKLIGLNVYDQQNQKIGDIKELLLDKDGKVAQVAIGVGGFLGMGEHDVAVKWTDLKFDDQPVPSTTSSANGTAGGGAAHTTGAGSSMGSSASSSSASSTKKNYPDHAVLSASKDQLKAMPQFNYSK